MKINVTRRRLIGLLGFGGVGATIACGSSTTSPTSNSSSSGPTSGNNGTVTANGACVVTPEETAGPYPDQLGMINSPAFFRQDVTEGRSGVPLTLTLTIVSVVNACAPVAAAAVEIWQCDASGNYSEYAQPGYNGIGQTFLRGLQTTDANGVVSFKTVYPGWYAGRATHIHVQVFRNGTVVKTTQIAFPEDVSSSVYQTGVYAAKGQNPTKNTSDNVFADGTTSEMATLSGSASAGFTATLTVGLTS